MADYCSVVKFRVNNRQMDIESECQLNISSFIVHFYTNFIFCKKHFKQDFSNTLNRGQKLVEYE